MGFLPVLAQESLQKKRSKADSIQAAFKARVDSIERGGAVEKKMHTGIKKTDSTRTAFASKIDSLKQSIPSDSLGQAGLRKVDSVQSAFYKSVDSLHSVYQKPLQSLDAESAKLQHTIDSLQSFNLPTNKFTRKLDSIQNLRTQQITKLNGSMDELKSKAMKPLKQITLPPQMQEPLDKLTNSINSYKLPSNSKEGFTMPGLSGKTGIPNTGKLSGMEGINLPGAGDAKLPGNIQQPDIKGLTGNIDKLNGATDKLNDATSKLGQVTQTMNQAGGYASDVKNLAQGNFNEVKNIDKLVESQVMKLDGANQLQKGTAEIDKIKQTTALMQNPDSLKAMGEAKAKEEVMQLAHNAVNHFAGQEQALQQAMDKMAKLKTKYTDVKSLAELPKRAPNPLKGKPLIERIVPGITFQIQKSAYFLLDVNALASYRLYPHWSVGAGWNYRFAIDDWEIIRQPRIYGPRASIEFKWKKGFNLRLLPELMNTEVPQSTDPSGREWVWSIFGGIKKDFTVYKSIKGNTELLYNFFDQKDSSPYTEKIGVRFGFEFPMKKVKKNVNEVKK